MGNILLTLAVGALGAIIALKLKIPAGAMIGSMVAVAIFSVFTGMAFFPNTVKSAIQTVTGAFLGMSVYRKDLKEIRSVAVPAVIMIVGLAVTNLLIGFGITMVSDIDLVSALLSCTPGGVTDMAIICMDMGGSSSTVALLQTARLIFVIAFFPGMMTFMSARFDKADHSSAVQEKEEPLENQKEEKVEKDHSLKMVLITLAFAAIGGVVGYTIGMPAGSLTFSMLAVAAYNVFTSKAYIPKKVKLVAQTCSGAMIGRTMTMNDVLRLKTMIVPMLVIVIGYLISNIALGFLIRKVSHLDLTTALFATTPAGVSDMALIASDIGGDAPKVAVLQIFRLVMVIATFPMMISMVVKIFG